MIEVHNVRVTSMLFIHLPWCCRVIVGIVVMFVVFSAFPLCLAVVSRVVEGLGRDSMVEVCM